MASRIGRWIVAIACLLVVAVAAGTLPPQDVTYQGRLLDSAGVPLLGPVDIEIGIWDAPAAGTRLYYEIHQNVTLTDGIFSILLGTGQLPSGTFDADLFAVENRYIEVLVDGELLEPRPPFSSVAYALQSGASGTASYAATAGDADTVDGSHAASLDQSAHVSDTGNPHDVTAAQVGAASSSDLTSHESNVSAHHARYGDSEAVAAIKAADGPGSGLNADLLDGQHATAFGTAAQVADLQATIAGLQATVTALQGELAAVQPFLDHVSVVGNDIYITGANLHVRSGSGATDGTLNGLGNLIIGYNENVDSYARGGSHNLVVGLDHGYTSYAGFVAGWKNRIGGPSASVSGGRLNQASEDSSSVSGGHSNTASGLWSWVGGGIRNDATRGSSTVSGGADNRADAQWSAVFGGDHETATTDHSTVVGPVPSLTITGGS
jgi:hypothetical protein